MIGVPRDVGLRVFLAVDVPYILSLVFLLWDSLMLLILQNTFILTVFLPCTHVWEIHQLRSARRFTSLALVCAEDLPV